MQLCGGLAVLFLTLSTACGLQCYSCIGAHRRSCASMTMCPVGANRCYTHNSRTFDDSAMITKGCKNSIVCNDPFITCCEGDYCNGAIPIGPSFILLLVSSAMIALFT